MQKPDNSRNGFGVCRGVHAFLFALVICLILAGIYIMTSHTPLQMDDYDYMFSWSTGKPLAGFPDILASQKAHYMLWGGRSITHTLVQSALYMGKTVFNMLNPLVYLCLMLEIAVLAGKPLREFPWETVCAAHLVLFFTVPFFGVTFLWLDGACNYLWGTALALLPLVILRSRTKGGFFSGKAAFPLAMILMFIGGWTNENTACGILAAHGLVLLEHQLRSKRVSITDILLFLCELAGVCVMLLAPGNHARASKYTADNLILEYGMRLVRLAYYTLRYTFVPLILLGLTALRNREWRTLSVSAHTGLVSALFAVLALLGSPEVSDRTFLGVVILLLVECFSWLQIRETENRHPRAAAALTAAVILCTAVGFCGAVQAVRNHESRWNEQLAKIEQAVQTGSETVQIESVLSESRYTMSIAFEQEPDMWPNSTYGKWFGLEIRGGPVQGQE